MILVGKFFVDLLSKYAHTYNKYDGIEEEDGKNWPQEGTKEDSGCTNEATEGNKLNYVSCTLLNQIVLFLRSVLTI